MSEKLKEALKKLGGDTTCIACRGHIKVGEDRLEVLLFELRYSADDEYDRRGESSGQMIARAICEECASGRETIELPNPWKFRKVFAELNAIDAIASGNPNDDVMAGKDGVMWRASSLQGMVAAIVEREEASGHGGRSDDDSVNSADREANMNSTRTRNFPVPEPPTEQDRRNRMAMFLETPAGRQMPRVLRFVAKKWADGETQGQIAQITGTNQTAVSRNLEEAERWRSSH